MPRFRPSLPLAALVLASLPAIAADTETFALGDSTITLHVHDFLDPQELQTLRLVGTDPQALALFMGEAPGHGAIAVAPAHGFIRDGMPATGVSALAQLPSAEAARDAALALCDQERTDDPACVVVLELAPN